jgi:hypothetical protein
MRMQRFKKRDRRLGYHVVEEIARNMMHREERMRRPIILWKDGGGSSALCAVVAPGTALAEAEISASMS